MTGRVPVAEVVDQGKLSAARRDNLLRVVEARRFAIDTLGLADTNAYTSYYDTGGKPVAYNLSAAAKDSLTPHIWHFPIVGSLPYIGFFDRDRAVAYQKELEAQNLDTALRPVSAYSSLGWFDDPVFSPMLDNKSARLTDLIIHEMTHTTIFLPRQVSFNESFAVFVGQQGTLLFLIERFGRDAAIVRETREEYRRNARFTGLVEVTYQRLAELYASPLSYEEKFQQRDAIFSWAQETFRRIMGPDYAKSSFLTEPLNNAVILGHGRYLQGLRFHYAVYRALGYRLDRTIALYKKAQRYDDPLRFIAEQFGLIDVLHGTALAARDGKDPN